MTGTTFGDRFEPSAHDHDNPDALWLDGTEPEAATTVPPFVFGRLTGIGSTYELHYLGSLAYDQQSRLNPTQAEALLDEIDFVLALVNDPLLRSAIDPVRETVTACIRSSPPRDLLIDLES